MESFKNICHSDLKTFLRSGNAHFFYLCFGFGSSKPSRPLIITINRSYLLMDVNENKGKSPLLPPCTGEKCPVKFGSHNNTNKQLEASELELENWKDLAIFAQPSFPILCSSELNFDTIDLCDVVFITTLMGLDLRLVNVAQDWSKKCLFVFEEREFVLYCIIMSK